MAIQVGAAGAVVDKIGGARLPTSISILVLGLGVFVVYIGVTGGSILKLKNVAGVQFLGPNESGGGAAGGGGSSGADGGGGQPTSPPAIPGTATPGSFTGETCPLPSPTGSWSDWAGFYQCLVRSGDSRARQNIGAGIAEATRAWEATLAALNNAAALEVAPQQGSQAYYEWLFVQSGR